MCRQHGPYARIRVVAALSMVRGQPMDSTHLKRLCLGEVSRILEVTGRLVNMDSGSDDVDALNEKAEVLRRLFAAAGAEVELWAADPPREKTWNVVSVFRGNGTARILILTHYDTVFPRGEAARRPFPSGARHNPETSGTLVDTSSSTPPITGR